MRAWFATSGASARRSGASAHAPAEALMWPHTVRPSRPPGAGESLLNGAGFVDVRRVDIPFAWEFPDPETYALASTGPAFEAIRTVGEEAFMRCAVDLATARVRDGLPLRATVDVRGPGRCRSANAASL